MVGEPFAWPEPQWLSGITDANQQTEARIRFFLALAALYCSPKGNLDDLSIALGKKPGTVRVYRHRGRPGAKTAIGIEHLLGRDLFPHELFLPVREG